MTTPKYPARQSPVAAYLEQAIARSKLSQAEIAEALGYERPNILSMFKTGATKVPIEIIPRLALEEYHPTLWMVIERAFGKLVSENAFDIIDTIRTASAGTDPVMTDEQEDALLRLFHLKTLESQNQAPNHSVAGAGGLTPLGMPGGLLQRMTTARWK